MLNATKLCVTGKTITDTALTQMKMVVWIVASIFPNKTRVCLQKNSTGSTCRNSFLDFLFRDVGECFFVFSSFAREKYAHRRSDADG